MKQMKTYHIPAIAAVLGGLFIAVPTAEATITLTAGVADWTFYYDSGADTFDVVLQRKGTAVATGLNTPYVGPPGGVGGSADNFSFSELVVNVSSSPATIVNGVDYIITPAAGTSYPSSPDKADLGFRTRFRELAGEPPAAVDQFAGFRMTLNLVNSTLPGDFIMFKFNSVTEVNDILFETSDGDLSHVWPAWGHSHWHFGFSEEGQYDLVFDITGVNGLGETVTSTGSTAITFDVVPEPSAALLSIFAIGALALRRRRP